MTHQCSCGRVVPDELVDRLRSGFITTLVCSKTRGGCGRRQDRTFFDERVKSPHFSGTTYDPAHDHDRLSRQIGRTYDAMQDRKWRTLEEIAAITGDPTASISARLRDLRKDRFGAYDVERRRRGEPKRGLFEYRVRQT